MADVKFEIVTALGVLSEGSKGWQKEINIVSWNDRQPKIDIREWGPDHERMGKGITLSRDEFIKLAELIKNLDVEDLDID